MGKSTLIMLFLVAFGPNGGEPSLQEVDAPPPVAAELTSRATAPERIEVPARVAEVLPSLPPQISTESMPAREPELPAEGRKNG